MKLQQLKYLKAIKENNLNISAAAGQLFTTQPGVSKQVNALEKELGVRIFERRGKQLSGISAIGEKIFQQIEQMLTIENNIKQLAEQYLDPNAGSLNIYTTHTIARYLLPNSVADFTQKYPNVHFHLYPTLPLQSKGLISVGHADFSIIAHDIGANNDLFTLPAYLWTLGLVVPADHPLLALERLTLADIAQYPLLSYEVGATGRKTQDEAFANANLTANYFMTAMDADVIKRYVELGFGIGIISSLAAKDIETTSLVYVDVNHLFTPSMAWICFSKDILLQQYMSDFLSSFAPHLTKPLLESVLLQGSNKKAQQLFAGIQLPVY